MALFLEMYAAAVLALCTQHAVAWLRRRRYGGDPAESNNTGYARHGVAPGLAVQPACCYSYSESDDGQYANL